MCTPHIKKRPGKVVVMQEAKLPSYCFCLALVQSKVVPYRLTNGAHHLLNMTNSCHQQEAFPWFPDISFSEVGDGSVLFFYSKE